MHLLPDRLLSWPNRFGWTVRVWHTTLFWMSTALALSTVLPSLPRKSAIGLMCCRQQQPKQAVVRRALGPAVVSRTRHPNLSAGSCFALLALPINAACWQPAFTAQTDACSTVWQGGCQPLAALPLPPSSLHLARRQAPPLPALLPGREPCPGQEAAAGPPKEPLQWWLTCLTSPLMLLSLKLLEAACLPPVCLQRTSHTASCDTYTW